MTTTTGSVPVPDPTKLTTDAVEAAKVEIEKLFDVKLSGSNDLVSEKFVGVKTEFTMRDIALAAAFKAAEAAVKQQNESNTLAIDKAGEAFTKQIDSLDAKIVDLKNSLDAKIDDLKERIAELSKKDWATVGAYIVGALGVVAILYTLLKGHQL